MIQDAFKTNKVTGKAISCSKYEKLLSIKINQQLHLYVESLYFKKQSKINMVSNPKLRPNRSDLTHQVILGVFNKSLMLVRHYIEDFE